MFLPDFLKSISVLLKRPLPFPANNKINTVNIAEFLTVHGPFDAI